jgi:hypothetical protein
MSHKYESTKGTHRQVLTQAQKNTICCLVGTVSLKDLEKRFGVGKKTIKRILKENKNASNEAS